MNSIEKEYEVTEKATIKRTRQICEIIIGELERRWNLSFGFKQNLDSIVKVQMILLKQEYYRYRPYLVEMLRYYEVNDYALLWQMVNQIYTHDLPPTQRMMFEEALDSLPIHEGMLSYDSHLQFRTQRGMLRVYNVNKWKSERFCFCAKQLDFRGHCHEVVQIFRDEFKGSFIETVKMPDLFGGYVYHSFYRTMLNDDVVDLTSGTQYDGFEYDSVYRPIEVIKYPAYDLSRRYEQLTLESNDVPSNWVPVLSLAVDKARRRER